VVSAEKVCVISDSSILGTQLLKYHDFTGGKAKPLKAAKKEKKELDEDEIAHQAKLKAGMTF
jgi:hypothetical protein